MLDRKTRIKINTAEEMNEWLDTITTSEEEDGTDDDIEDQNENGGGKEINY